MSNGNSMSGTANPETLACQEAPIWRWLSPDTRWQR
jgi:hypothetical protein